MIRLLLLLAALLAGPAHIAHAAEARTCVPGQMVELHGEAPAGAAVLVRWDGRAVGGATAQSDGRYTLVLRVGMEAPGQHVVTVVKRSAGQELRRFICEVPQSGTEDAEPTPALAVDEAPTPTAAAPTPPAEPPAPGPESTSAPAPGPTDVPTPEPAVPQPNVPQRVVQGQAPSGWAQLTTEAALAIAVPPRSEADVLRSYPAGTRVRLLGQSYRRWVSVQPAGAAAIGWMDAASLQMLTGTPGPESTTEPRPEPTDAALPTTGVLTPAAILTGTSTLAPTASPTPASTARQARPISVELLAPSPSLSPTPAPVARTITVSVCRTRSAATTTSCAAPVGGTRVELLLTVTDELLASGTTGTDGTATLAVSVPAGAGLRLRLPAIGVAGPLAERDQAVTVALPPALLLNGGGAQ